MTSTMNKLQFISQVQLYLPNLGQHHSLKFKGGTTPETTEI